MVEARGDRQKSGRGTLRDGKLHVVKLKNQGTYLVIVCYLFIYKDEGDIVKRQIAWEPKNKSYRYL